MIALHDYDNPKLENKYSEQSFDDGWCVTTPQQHAMAAPLGPIEVQDGYDRELPRARERNTVHI
jgi:hypothetical protein